MMASATDADARRERGKMPAAASDQVSNEADASVPPSRFVAYPTVSSVKNKTARHHVIPHPHGTDHDCVRTKPHQAIPTSFKFHDFQKEGLARAALVDGLILADEQGLGKSIAAYA